ncbi:hypothetical protein GCM10010383_37110 [Streptomyces lomondensis]|uniref:Uncharacterized protein n=1 Tax=Streptomyces lomondensis TaxID=68229 RepID=A0ABQ2X7Q6_9ACTN|nr:hypothetical protein GCM10010383_37110 [Streptomyces lomondensis]
MPGYGYYAAKVAQENAVRGSGVPYGIVRAPQFFGAAAARTRPRPCPARRR